MIKEAEALLELLVEHHVVNGAFHLSDLLRELILLVLNDIVVMITAVGEAYLEIDLGLLQLLLVFVEACRKLLEEVYDVLGDLAHLVVEILLVGDRVHDQGLGLQLAALNVGSRPVLNDQVEGLALLELSIVLDNEILEIVESDVDVLVGVFHVLRELLDQGVENDGALLVEAGELIGDVAHELLGDSLWVCVIQSLDQLDPRVEKLLLLNLHALEDVYSSLGVHKLLGVEAVYEPFDGIVLLNFVESHNGRLPCLIEAVKLGFFLLNDVGVESITLHVLGSVLGVLVGHLLLHELIDLWRKEKSDIDEFLAHSSEVRATTLLLKGL